MNAALFVLRPLRLLVCALVLATLLVSACLGAMSLSGAIRVRVEQSGSMAPVIGVNDLVIYRPELAAQLRAGQVIGFRRDGAASLITHRVTQVSWSKNLVDVITRGDANNAADVAVGQFHGNDRVWRKVAVIPSGGLLVRGLTGPSGVTFLLSLLPLFLGLPWLEAKLKNIAAGPYESHEQLQARRVIVAHAAIGHGGGHRARASRLQRDAAIRRPAHRL